MDALTHLVFDYFMFTVNPTLIGLRFHLLRCEEGDYKEPELMRSLNLAKEVFELREEYEICAIIHQILQNEIRSI